MTGMFPEYLKNKMMTTFYEETGAQSYLNFGRAIYNNDNNLAYLFEMLSTNFGIYRTVMTNARDKYMKHFDEKECFRIPTNCNFRERGRQMPDGTILWTDQKNNEQSYP